MTTFKTSADGRRKIRNEEGERLKAYKDSQGFWTVGVGHAETSKNPPKPKRGMVITSEQSDQILERDLADVEAEISRLTKPITQQMGDALASLIFNIGVGAFRRSSVRKRIEMGDYQGAANAFLMWTKPPELTPRRHREMALFLSGGLPSQPRPKAPKPSVYGIGELPPNPVVDPEPEETQDDPAPADPTPVATTLDEVVAKSSTATELRGHLAVVNDGLTKAEAAKDSAIVRWSRRLGSLGWVGAAGAPATGLAVSAADPQQHQSVVASFIDLLHAYGPLTFVVMIASWVIGAVGYAFIANKRVEMQRAGLVLPDARS